MRSLTRTTLAASIAMSLSSAVYAADLDPPIIEHTPEIVPVEVGSNWYLRGDIGYVFTVAPSASWRAVNFFNESVDDTWMAGIGFGYQFNDYFRADATLDYHGKFDYRGNTWCAPACGRTRESTNFQAWTFMLNGYLEMGDWYGFRPYVGAGIGTSYISTDRVRGVNPIPPNSVFNGGDRWALSGALMAGGSYAIDDNLLLDAGYRYLWMGDARSGNDPTGGLPGHVGFEDLQAHEIRVGLRYMID